MYSEINNPEAYHAALYIRLSKEDESEGLSQSVTNQKSLLSGFALQHCLKIYEFYIDDGWSGTNFERPEFKRMIADIEAGKVNLVITKDLSRLGRDYIMTGYYMERYFPEKRVRYISILDGIDTGVESTANDITPFRAIMNDMYAKDISKKIKSVKHDKQKKGEFIGGKPVYGYKMHPSEKNKIIIDEAVETVVKRIFAMALEGKSCRSIASVLNEEAIPPPAVYAGLKRKKAGPYTGLWNSEGISYMLQNETYIGNMVQGKSMKINYKSQKYLKQERDKWVVVEGTHEPIIEKEIFQRVQIFLKNRRHLRSRTYDFLLKGFIYCHECGYPMAVINRPTASGEDRLFFICRTYQRFTKAGVCTCHSIKEKTVTECVISEVRKLCGKYLDIEKMHFIAERFLTEEQKNQNLETDISAIKRKIDHITYNLDRMYLDRLNGLLLDADFDRIYRHVKEERESLEQKVQEMEKKENGYLGAEDKAGELVQKYLDSLYTSRELLVYLIERVELTKSKEIIIHFRFREPEAFS